MTDNDQPSVYVYDVGAAAQRLTITDYDQAIDRAVQVLWRLLPSEVQEGREPADIRPWVVATADAFGDPS